MAVNWKAWSMASSVLQDCLSKVSYVIILVIGL